MESTTFSERLSLFMKTKGLNDNQLTVKANLSNGLIGKVINGKSALSAVNIAKILQAFPDLSSDWLLIGRGNMLIESGPTPRESTRHEKFDEIETRPRIPFDAAAGSLSIVTESVTESECERFPVIPRFPRYDFTIMVKGNSMEPEFQSGDEIACRLIDQSSFIQWGRPHVLDTTQGVVLKRIYNNNDTILCHSDNNLYQDFEIPKVDILHIAIVVGSVRLY